MSQIPPFLNIGDQVELISPSSPSDSLNWLKGKEVLESWGLKVSLSPNINSKHHGLAGTDQQRLADLQNALDNPHTKAIFPIRGGYGLTRIIDQLDFSKFIENPKWIIGFSDITALHLAVNALEIASIHGPMPNNFLEENSQDKLEFLKKLLFGESIEIPLQQPQNSFNKSLKGKIIGGNLSLICQNIGTNTFPNPENKILFLEDVGEKYYHIDRMMVQLKRSGLFHYLNGLIIGQFSECLEAKLRIGQSPYEIIQSHLLESGLPIIWNFSAGHIPYNIPFFLQKEIEIQSDKLLV